jgi:hypothetical protein
VQKLKKGVIVCDKKYIMSRSELRTSNDDFVNCGILFWLMSFVITDGKKVEEICVLSFLAVHRPPATS